MADLRALSAVVRHSLPRGITVTQNRTKGCLLVADALFFAQICLLPHVYYPSTTCLLRGKI